MQKSENEEECLKQLNVLMEQTYEDLKMQNENVVLQELAKTTATTKEIVISIATGVGVSIGLGVISLGTMALAHFN